MLHKTLLETEMGLRGRVTFTLPPSIWAGQIHLVGDFNNWDTTAHPMKQHRDGSWSLTLDLKPGQEYEFRYLVDGEQWINDCRADKYVQNSHGSHNSVVVVHTPVEFIFEGGPFEPERLSTPPPEGQVAFDVSPVATKAGVGEK